MYGGIVREAMKGMLVLGLLAGIALGGIGCSLFQSDVATAALKSGVEMIEKLVKEKVGKSLGDVPMVCETETHPEEQKILLLCTVCYGEQKGGDCK